MEGDNEKVHAKKFSVMDIPNIVYKMLAPYVGRFDFYHYISLEPLLEEDYVPEDVKNLVRYLWEVYLGFFVSGGDDQGEMEKQAPTKLIPPEYRWYIKDDMIRKLPKGVHVYKGPRGGIFVDLRELKDVRNTYDVNVESKNKSVYTPNWIEFAFKSKSEVSEEEKKIWKYLVEFSSYKKALNMLFNISDIEVEVVEEEGEGDKWKVAYIEGKIKFFGKNITEEERVKQSDTALLLYYGELNKAIRTIGWYYYHAVGHLMFREYGFDEEMLGKLREWVGKVKISDYGNLDLEEFWCEAFALHSLTGGRPSKYGYVPKEFERLISDIIGKLFDKGYAGKERIGGYVYDSFDTEVGVKKSEPEGLNIKVDREDAEAEKGV
ncbi:hypothetical protein [Thermococcus waiotapuensis]|uniref:Uncharacterized protein n=1 Tax=Thermococcus waiotapuensis TaxID=90909 RepID=A0AAE4NUU3_9EURY|nr:hypothetical protein [Thermococcus waiotapuensis]MDV3103737.1 hypothetical protein [Thermococcus waiotapuensis]